MKIRIGKLLDKAARSLLVAGGLGVPAAVMAQTASYPILQRPIAVTPGAEARRSLPQTTRAPHLAEIKVELAWLADPVTSPYRLEARTVGGALEVRGQVLNEGVLAHALQLARAESGMPVVSKVQLNPALRAPGSGKPQELLHREAFHALRQAFPAQAPSIAITTLADGEIVLKGTVATYEDKLAISRHLRQATSCSCILNQLQVLAEPQQSRAGNSPAAATLLAPAPLKPQPAQPAAQRLLPALVALGSPSPAPHSSAEIIGAGDAPPGWKAAAAGSAESVMSKSSADTKPASARRGPEPQAQSTAKPTGKPVVYPTKWRRLEPGEIALPSKVVPAAVYKDTATAATQGESATPSKPRTYLRVIPGLKGTSAPMAQTANPPTAFSRSGTAAKTDSGALAQGSSPPHSRPAPLQVPSLDGTAARAPRPVTAVAQSSAAPGPTTGTNLAKSQPYVSDGVILVDSMIKPASHAAPGAGSKPPAIVRTGPYVTSGVILFSDAANARPLPTNPTLAALQSQLQERIAAVCGKPSRDVEVTALSETNVAVRVKANSTLEGEEFSNRIFQLPELGPCQVSLDVLVMR